jgi:hypothetical protein
MFSLPIDREEGDNSEKQCNFSNFIKGMIMRPKEWNSSSNK